MTSLKYEKKILLLLLTLHLLRGLLYSITIPLWQTPDEHWHFEYIKLLENIELPAFKFDEQHRKEVQSRISQSLIKHQFWKFRNIQPQAPSLERNAFSRGQLRQPPLYYAMCAFLLKLFPFNDIEIEAYALRGVSVGLGAVVIYLAYIISREMFANDLFITISVPLFIVFLPQYTFMCSGINNDKLAEVLFALLLTLIVMGIKHQFNAAGLLSVFILVILGVLTKRTFFAAIPLCCVFFLIRFKNSIYKSIITLVMFSITGIAILAVVNTSFFKVAFRHYIEVPFPQAIAKIIHSMKTFPLHLGHYRYYGKLLLSGFWASFGWLDIYLSEAWYTLLLCIDAIAVIGLSIYGVRLFKRQVVLQPWQKKCLALLALSTFFVVVQTFIRDSILFSVFPHSRLLFVVIIPISLFFMMGIREWLRPINPRQGLVIVMLLLACFDAICFFSYILPYYYGVFG